MRFPQVRIGFCLLAAAIPGITADNSNLEKEVRALFSNGVWDRALARLESVPDAKNNPAHRELLATAYLYSASRIDTRGNFEKAQALMKQSLDQGGKARFFVSLGQDAKKEKHLVEATPGELIIDKATVAFQPQEGTGDAVLKWEKSALAECALNPGYGASSHSFHITASQGKDKTDFNFRPWHNSAQESDLICSLIGIAPGAQQGKSGRK